MNRPPTTALTWGTLAAAVASACLLATGESGLPQDLIFPLCAPSDATAIHALLPAEPTAAGPRRSPASH